MDLIINAAIPPAHLPVRTHQITGKRCHIISHQHLDSQKATPLPPGGIGHIVAVFQIVATLASNQGLAESAGFLSGQIVFGAVNLVCLIQFFGTGRSICFQANIPVRIQKIIHIVVAPFDCLPVLFGVLTFGELEVVVVQLLQSHKGSEQDSLGGDDGFYIVGLAQGFHPHIIVHAQKDMLQASTGKPVLGYFPDAAVLHIGTKQSSQHSADL